MFTSIVTTYVKLIPPYFNILTNSFVRSTISSKNWSEIKKVLNLKTNEDSLNGHWRDDCVISRNMLNSKIGKTRIQRGTEDMPRQMKFTILGTNFISP